MYELPWDSVGHTVCFYGAFMVFLSFLELSTEDWNSCRFGTTWGWVNTDRISRFLVNCLFKVMSVCIPWALHVFSHFWQLVICHSENQLQLIVTSQAAAYKTQRHIFTLTLSAYGWCSFCSSLLFRSCSLAWAGAKPFCCLGSSG